MKYTLSVQYRKKDDKITAWLEEFPHIITTKDTLEEATQMLANRYTIELTNQLSAIKTGNVKVSTQDLTEVLEQAEQVQNQKQEEATVVKGAD